MYNPIGTLILDNHYGYGVITEKLALERWRIVWYHIDAVGTVGADYIEEHSAKKFVK